MPYPGSVAAGQTGHVSDHNAMRDDIQRILKQSAMGGAVIPLRSFEGVNDDARLAAFATYAAAQTYKGIVCLLDEPKQYVFNNRINVYDGFSIATPSVALGQQNKAGSPVQNVVKLNMAGGWLSLNGQKVTSCMIAGLSFDCGSSTRVVEPGGQMFFWKWRDIGFQNGLSLIGSKATKQGHDGVFFEGTWNINNVREQFIHLGGSDSEFTPTSMYLDSPGNTYMADSDFLVHYNSATKCGTSNWYVTCDRHSGFLIDYGGAAGVMRMHNMTVEGRNATTPCYGALIRVAGGANLAVNNMQLNYAMTSPSATGRNDAGYIHNESGFVSLVDSFFILAQGQATDTPILYVKAGGASVRNVHAWDSSGTKFKPVVKQAVAGLIDADSSVTVVTG